MGMMGGRGDTGMRDYLGKEEPTAEQNLDVFGG